MAQVVKLEPGDILVIGNCGNLPGGNYFDGDVYGAYLDRLSELRRALGLGHIMLFEGDVDLSKLPAGWTPDAVAGA